jgi:hypothetical protein
MRIRFWTLVVIVVTAAARVARGATTTARHLTSTYSHGPDGQGGE